MQQKIVSGWNDPRMPTISGFRRRGYTPSSVRAFCDKIGVAKFNSTIDMVVLENSIREELNKTAPRVMAVHQLGAPTCFACTSSAGRSSVCSLAHR